MESIHQKHGLIYATDTERGDAWIFSRRGLLRSALRGNRKIKRGWSGNVQEVDLQPGGTDSNDNHRTLPARDGLRRVVKQHRAAHSRFGKDERIPACNINRYERDQKQFQQIYGNVPILPPDQYRSLLVNLTEGCSHNRCTFCQFYRDHIFDVKSSEALRTHLHRIREFFGPDLEYFTGVFLGAGDALTAPMERLVDTLRRLGTNELSVESSVASFAQGNIGRSKSAEEFNRLHNLGLRRVYLGLETGCDELLDRLNKPFSTEDFTVSVNKLKSAGINVGLIILLGAGGRDYREQHRGETLKLLRELPLDENDRLYLSPLVGSETGLVSRENPIPLDRSDMEDEKEKFHREIDSKQTVTEYDVQEFLY